MHSYKISMETRVVLPSPSTMWNSGFYAYVLISMETMRCVLSPEFMELKVLYLYLHLHGSLKCTNPANYMELSCFMPMSLISVEA